MENKKTDKQLMVGVVILLVGAALLANNFGLFSYEIRRYLFRWEVILIVLGIAFISNREHRSTGIILLVIGGVFYLRNFFDLHFNFWQVFWPGMLILAGVMILFRGRSGAHIHDFENLGDDVIDDLAVFGGGDRIVTSQSFKGGKITAVFGGSNFNMSRARLAPGKNYIDVFAMFGGTKLVVPEDWNIKITVTSIFGGFSDKHRMLPVESTYDKETMLIIRGFVLFGGGEIKSF
jgi:predicted membrane protein